MPKCATTPRSKSLCQACDQPMMEDYTPERYYTACTNLDCICNNDKPITECPKCSSKDMLRIYEATVTDWLDDDSTWVYLHKRGRFNMRFLCRSCGIVFQPRGNARAGLQK